MSRSRSAFVNVVDRPRAPVRFENGWRRSNRNALPADQDERMHELAELAIFGVARRRRTAISFANASLKDGDILLADYSPRGGDPR